MLRAAHVSQLAPSPLRAGLSLRPRGPAAPGPPLLTSPAGRLVGRWPRTGATGRCSAAPLPPARAGAAGVLLGPGDPSQPLPGIAPRTCEHEPHQRVPDEGAVDDVPKPPEVSQDEVVEGGTGLQQVVEARPEFGWGRQTRARRSAPAAAALAPLTQPVWRRGSSGRGTYARCS